MLQQLRNKYVAKYLMGGVMVVTIPSFIAFYGFSSRGHSDMLEGRGDLVTVTVGGHTQGLGQFELKDAKYRLINEYRYTLIRMGQEPTNRDMNVIESELTNRDIAEYAISYALLDDIANRQGIAISPAEISRSLGEQGVTEASLKAHLQQQGQSRYQFVREQQKERRWVRAEQTIEEKAHVTLLEMWNEYLLGSEKIQVDHVSIPVANEEAKVEVTDAEIAARYEKDKATLVTDAQRIYRYAAILPPPIDRNPTITEDDIKKAYDTAPADDPEVSRQGGVRVRTLVLNAPEATTDTVRLAKRADIEQIRGRLAAGEDFARIADQYSDDPSNIKLPSNESDAATKLGGLVEDLITTDTAINFEPQYGHQWAQEALSGTAGHLSGILETPKGFALLKVEERVQPGKKTLAEVHQALENRVRTSKINASREAQKTAAAENKEKARAAVAQNTTLDSIAVQLGVDVRETSPTITTQSFIPGVGSVFTAMSSISKLKAGEISEPIQTGDSKVVVLSVKEEIPSRQKTLDEAREGVRATLRTEKAVAKARELAESLRIRLEKGDSLTSAAVELGLKPTQPEPFTRQAPPQELAGARELNSKVFGAKPGSVVVLESGAAPRTTAFEVIKVLNVTEPTKEDFVKEMKNYERGLSIAKRDSYRREFRRQAAAKAKATYADGFLNDRDAAGADGEG